MSKDKVVSTPPTRILRSGRVVTDLNEPKPLTITTKCPNKWVCVDLETGEVFMGSKTGWRRATIVAVKETLSALHFGPSV